MKPFMNEDFILKTETEKKLYEMCKDLLIIDYHCHINPQEIYENRKFNDITEVWLGGDRYKWRLIRSNGVPEEEMTGNADNQLLDTIIGAFQGSEVAGKNQHGSAWWFNDTKTGMEEQSTSLVNLSILGNFIGMLTDSRSFLSYTHHEYFRRIMCNLIGEWVENGEYPNDEKALREIVEGISYYNAKEYFGI